MKYSVCVCAVIFGVDGTILNIEIGNEFRFERKSLKPEVDHLDELFDITPMGLRREYETARIDTDTDDVVCVLKNFEIEWAHDTPEEWDGHIRQFDDLCDEILKHLDDKVRALRLICEAPIRFKKLSI